MYKVFFNNKVLYLLGKNQKKNHNKQILNYSSSKVDELLDNFFSEKIYEDEISLECENTVSCWKEFCSRFKLIEAAGGLVVNDNNELLFIKRNGCWDLPKGKLEKNEEIEVCALREIQEECGINDISLLNKITETYHTYIHKEKRILKRTYWFLVKSSGYPSLFPQKEEGITEVKWFKQSDLTLPLSNTYLSIKDVMNSFNTGEF